MLLRLTGRVHSKPLLVALTVVISGARLHPHTSYLSVSTEFGARSPALVPRRPALAARLTR